jgi:hypothetical protein
VQKLKQWQVKNIAFHWDNADSKEGGTTKQ